ncbi:nitroreductase [Burkholderia pseudomallei]|nr:nitroreductase [Burkholderia pseudomallei]
MTQSRDLTQNLRREAFQDLVRSRYSIRDFQSEPVPLETIREVVEDARWTPSNCNTQPWQVHIVSGAKRDELSKALIAANAAGQFSKDFTWDDNQFTGELGRRRREHGAFYYGSLGVSRNDADGRRLAAVRNFSFFGAPHAAFFFLPTIGDNVRVAADVAMYAQTFLLSLHARGLGGVPQTVLGFYADTVRAVLDISPEMKLLFGVSFGFPQWDSRVNQGRNGREETTESVVFHG